MTDTVIASSSARHLSTTLTPVKPWLMKPSVLAVATVLMSVLRKQFKGRGYKMKTNGRDPLNFIVCGVGGQGNLLALSVEAARCEGLVAVIVLVILDMFAMTLFSFLNLSLGPPQSQNGGSHRSRTGGVPRSRMALNRFKPI